MVGIRQYLSITIIILFTGLLAACQLIAPINNQCSNESAEEITAYSQYYLWLKSLSQKQLLAEETQQKYFIKNQLDDKTFNQEKLIFIYSLANTPLHQPYKAKRLLNKYLLADNNMSKNNLAFTLLLRDQLNIQLHLHQKQVKLKQDFTKKNDEKQASIEQLSQDLEHMKQQLLLLKQIDKNINDRG